MHSRLCYRNNTYYQQHQITEQVLGSDTNVTLTTLVFNNHHSFLLSDPDSETHQFRLSDCLCFKSNTKYYSKYISLNYTIFFLCYSMFRHAALFRQRHVESSFLLMESRMNDPCRGPIQCDSTTFSMVFTVSFREHTDSRSSGQLFGTDIYKSSRWPLQRNHCKRFTLTGVIEHFL